MIDGGTLHASPIVSGATSIGATTKDCCYATHMITDVLSFTIREPVHAPPEAVWAVLGDFGTEHRWSSSLAYCERTTDVVAVGTARICTLPKPLMGRLQVREELTEYTPGEALAYALDGAAGPFATAASRWAVVRGSDDQTIVSVTGTFMPRARWVRFVWPLVRFMVARLARQSVGELQSFVLKR